MAPFTSGEDWLAFVLTAFVAFAVYVFTLAPEVTLGFSGVFSTGAMHGGVAHPPGYPVWTCYAWMFTKLIPVGSIAWRVGMSSAVATALACGLIAMLVSIEGAIWLKALAPDGQLTRRARAATRVVSGCTGGLVFGFSGPVWQRAVLADAWAMTLLLLVLFLFLMRRWAHSPRRNGLLFAAMMTYGMGLTNSQSLAVLAPAIPWLALAARRDVARELFLVTGIALAWVVVRACRDGLFLYVYVPAGGDFWLVWVSMAAVSLGAAAILIGKSRAALTEWKALIGSSTALIAGLVFYLYMPIASMTNPPINWGYARTEAGFVHTLTRGQYERVRPTQGAGDWIRQLGAFALETDKKFGAVCLLPILSLPWAWRRLRGSQRAWMVGLAACFCCLGPVLIAVLNPATSRGDRDLIGVFDSLSYVVLALWLGYGIAAVIALSSKATPPVRSSTAG
jgi:hypothetical protein